MRRNVEIKARIDDETATRALVAALADGEPETIVQEDVFFATPRGRLKLRHLSPERGELIFYERPDRSGPKTSTYAIVATDRPRDLEAVLEAAYGIRGVVRKTRELYMAGRTRIHLDVVDGLGAFLELEVILADDEDPAAGEREARALMTKLGVETGRLVEGAYVDLLGSNGT